MDDNWYLKFFNTPATLNEFIRRAGVVGVVKAKDTIVRLTEAGSIERIPKEGWKVTKLGSGRLERYLKGEL